MQTFLDGMQIKALVFLTLHFSICTSLSVEIPDDKVIEKVWEALKVFEGSATKVTNDFDCQGISVGVGQWNLGKSYESVKSIINANSKGQTQKLMPTFGTDFKKSLNTSQKEALRYVRSLHSYADKTSCDAKVRKAKWTRDGLKFKSELSKLLGSRESIQMQRKLRKEIFITGWKNAMKWAKANRGSDANPTLREIAYFVDMRIFNGGGLDKFGLSYSPSDLESIDKGSLDAIRYLRKADDKFLLHKVAARKNADLLKPQKLSRSDRELFFLSYQISQKLKKNYSRQFRLTVINRRSAILFGQAFYSDKDDSPTKINL